MNRYFLGTNIVLFIISGDLDGLSFDTLTILNNYNNQLYISSIDAVEIV